MDRVSGRQTTNGRNLKAADDRFLNRFLTVGLNAVSDLAIRDKAV
jgi:hypothetical protein